MLKPFFIQAISSDFRPMPFYIKMHIIKLITRVTRIYIVQYVKWNKYSLELYFKCITIRVHVLNVVTIFWEE